MAPDWEKIQAGTLMEEEIGWWQLGEEDHVSTLELTDEVCRLIQTESYFLPTLSQGQRQGPDTKTDQHRTLAKYCQSIYNCAKYSHKRFYIALASK